MDIRSDTWCEFPPAIEPRALYCVNTQCNIHFSYHDLVIQQLKGKYIHLLSLARST